ncbi:MAG: pyridoxal phosphate-dependent aminotransferase [Candidatus Hatepunaea meridiana]|nr:pyridoxal phosphate-dependent aminotransferase [Candidatus Hatepunaea meridiana]
MYKPSTFPKQKRPPTVFNQIEFEVEKRAELGQKVIALHRGDAYLPLPVQLQTPVPNEDELYGTGLNRYGSAFGDSALIEALLDKVRTHNKLPAEDIDSIQVTSGATSALHAGFTRILEADAEILTLAPYWSILRVVAAQAHVKLVEVPFFDGLAKDDSFDPATAMKPYLTTKTKAIYLNTPSNPTGVILDGVTLEKIGDFAKEHDLWVFSDEAYEDFIFDGSKHISIGSLPDMFERTISVHSFSKSFGASGIRVGYATAPAPVISELHHGVVGSHYQSGRYDMRMAWRGMQKFDDIVNTFKPDYASAWQWVRDNLKAEAMPSISGFYFFLKLGKNFENLSSMEKVFKMLDAGVVLSPGEYFGYDYSEWARLCFTIVPLDEVKEGVEKLNELLG